MELGMIGLGRMGLNMTIRLRHGGHRVVAHNRTREPIEKESQLSMAANISATAMPAIMRARPQDQTSAEKCRASVDAAKIAAQAA